MKCCDCGEEIPKDAIIIEESGTGSVCPKCSGQEVALNVERDVPGPEANTAMADLEIARELISGAGQLKGQKIERAKIVQWLRDEMDMPDTAGLIEARRHWTDRKGLYRGD